MVVALYKYGLFSPPTLGKMNPIWRAYFSKGLVQPPTRKPWWFSSGSSINEVQTMQSHGVQSSGGSVPWKSWGFWRVFSFFWMCVCVQKTDRKTWDKDGKLMENDGKHEKMMEHDEHFICIYSVWKVFFDTTWENHFWGWKPLLWNIEYLP